MSHLQSSEHDPLSRFRLEGRVAFLSGAAGHLGRPMAKALASAGAHVVLNGRNQDGLDVLAGELKSAGLSASVACFDVTDGSAVRRYIGMIGEKHRRLDVLVNNASGGGAGSIASATTSDFEQLYRVNVVAAFELLQAALPLLKEAGSRNPGGASVINIASMYGSVSSDPSIYGTSGANNPPYYGAAKAALIQFTRYAACHLGAQRIRVNSISPGPFPTAEVLEKDPEFHGKLKEKNPMHRTGDPAELQGPVLFLASDAASYVTGVDLAVDGGWTAW